MKDFINGEVGSILVVFELCFLGDMEKDVV